MGDVVLGDTAFVGPGTSAIRRRLHHAEEGRPAIRMVRRLARKQQASVRHLQQAAPADPRVRSGMAVHGIRQGRKRFGVRPGPPVVRGTHVESYAGTGDPGVLGDFRRLGKGQVHRAGVKQDLAARQRMRPEIDHTSVRVGRHQFGRSPGLSFVTGAAGPYVEEGVAVVAESGGGRPVKQGQQVTIGGSDDVRMGPVPACFAVDR